MIALPRTRWWFQICFIFTPTWGNDPIWLAHIFLNGLVQPPTRWVLSLHFFYKSHMKQGKKMTVRDVHSPMRCKKPATKTCTWQSFPFLAGCFWDATAVWPEGVGDEYHHPGTGTKLRLVDLATTCVAHKADAKPIIEKSRKIDNRFFLQT